MNMGRPGPPDPGGQASHHIGQSPSRNGPLGKGVIQKPNPAGPTLSGTVQKPNQTIPAVKESSGSARKPQRGKQKASSAARSQQPGSTSGNEVRSKEAALSRASLGTAKETTTQLHQRKREKDAVVSATLVGDALSEDKQAASESKCEDEDESRVSEPSQTASPTSEFPFPMTFTKSIVWVDFGAIGTSLFGSLIGVPGVTVEVGVPTAQIKDPSIVLSMRVNKNDLSRPISEIEAEVSRFDLVLEPWIQRENGSREHNFRWTYL